MTAAALLTHYIEYLTSPFVLLTLAVVVAPILISVYSERILFAPTPETGVPGCQRLGLAKRSNLSDQYNASQETKTDGPPKVKALFTYPIKSCCGVELAASQVEATGLSFDRLFTFAQLVSKPGQNGKANDDSELSGDWKHEWQVITEREFPRLALIRTQLWLPKPPALATSQVGRDGGSARKDSGLRERERSRPRGTTLTGPLERGSSTITSSTSTDKAGTYAENGGCLVVRFTLKPVLNVFGLRTETVTIQLPLKPTSHRAEVKEYSYDKLTILEDSLQAINMTNEVNATALSKLKSFLGVSIPLAIFRVDDGHMRAVDTFLPESRPNEEFKVGFADAFPVNLLSMASVRAVEDSLHTETVARHRLDARRFRSNIYISGVPAHTEDTFQSITINRRIGRDERGLYETDALYHVACRSTWVKLPNVNSDTGLRDRDEQVAKSEDMRTLGSRAYPSFCVGMQMIPLFERGIIRVGDYVKVLETGEHHYEDTLPSK